MIEETILKYLNDKADVPVYMEEPKSHPKRFAVLEKTGGGGGENFIFTSTFALQSYAESKYQAAFLNKKLKQIMLDRAADIPGVSRISYGGDYGYTDPQTKQYRYQMVLIVTHY